MNPEKNGFQEHSIYLHREVIQYLRANDESLNHILVKARIAQKLPVFLNAEERNFIRIRKVMLF